MRHTDETRAKLSALRQGANNPFYGRTHTPEARQRISESSRNRNLARKYEPAPQRITVPSGWELAYLAGLIDADGSVRFKIDHSTAEKVKRPFVSVYNTNLALIDWLVSTLGHGSVTKGNMGREQVMAWTIQGARDVYALLTALRPMLIVKASDADAALNFLKEKYQWV